MRVGMRWLGGWVGGWVGGWACEGGHVSRFVNVCDALGLAVMANVSDMPVRVSDFFVRVREISVRVTIG
jgi:hypothetical protein